MTAVARSAVPFGGTAPAGRMPGGDRGLAARHQLREQLKQRGYDLAPGGADRRRALLAWLEDVSRCVQAK